MKCLNKSLPIVKEALSVIKSEPALAKIIDRLGDNISMANIISEWDTLQKQADARVDPQLLDKLNNFTLFEEEEALCPNGICNYTAKKSEEKLAEVGLNPYSTGYGGSKVYVSVKSPLAPFDIQHFISIVAIGRALYAYDMPQSEFISDDFYGRDSMVKKKTAYKPRLIPFTIEDIAANYNINYTEAAKFIKSVINNKGYVNEGTTVEEYIKKNIVDGEYYFNELTAITESAGIPDKYFERDFDFRVRSEKEKIEDSKLFTKNLSETEQEKIARLLETKLKIRTREYVPKTKNEFYLRDLIKNVIGNNSFLYDYTKGLPSVLSDFKTYLTSAQFKEDLKNNYKKAKIDLESIDATLNEAYSKRNLMLNFLTLAKKDGWDNAINQFDAKQKYTIRTNLQGNIIEKYKSEKQRIFITERYYKNMDNLLKKKYKEETKEGRFQSYLLDKFKATQRLNKASTIVNYLNAFEGDTDYLYEVIANEASRQYSFFQGKGQQYFQLAGTETVASTPAVRKRVNEWLKRVGINVEEVKDIVVNGQKFDANAVVDFGRNLIQYVQGKEDAITEEGLHYGVEIIEQTNTKLFNKLLTSITKYPIYKETLQTYGSNPYYQIDGKPDIRKIKKEAIAKKLVENLIKGTTDTLAQKEEIATLWQQIKDWIQSLIKKAGFNPFATAVDDILAAKEGVSSTGYMFELGDHPKRDRLFNKIREVSKTIDKREDGYWIGDKKIPKRVTDFSKAVGDRLFGDKELTRTEHEKFVNELKAGYGSAGHLDMENIFDTFIDTETGFVRPSPLDDSNYVAQTTPAIYNALRNNFIERLDTFEEGTRFLKEAVIYNGTDIAGTVDFMAISKDGKITILDWKFAGFDPERHGDDVPWYSKKAWRIQMLKYRQVLEAGYSVSSTDFVQTEMIPIKTDYKNVLKEDGNYYPILKGIEIGNVRAELEDKDYLLPVAIERQSSGDRELDKLLTKLRGFRESTENLPAKTAEERLRKAEQLNSLEKAFRHLQMKKSVAPLIEQAEVYTKNLTSLFDLFNTTLADADFAQLLKDEEQKRKLNEFGIRIDKAFDDIRIFTNLSNELKSLFKGELTPLQKEMKAKVSEVSEKAREFESDLEELVNKFTNKVSDALGTGDATQAEIAVDVVAKLFNPTSKLQPVALQMLAKLRSEVQNKIDFKTDEENKQLVEIEKRYSVWAKAKGLTIKNFFTPLMKMAENKLIDQYQPEFYTELKKAVTNKDIAWIAENVDIEAFSTKLDENLASTLEYLKTKPYPNLSPAELEKRREKDIKDAKEKYDLSTPQSKGWILHYNTMRGFPTKVWESEEWKNLNAKGNEPALELYNWIRDINEKASKTGYLPKMKNNSKRTFLPFVPKGVIETMVFGGKTNIAQKILESFTIDEDTIGYGEIDKTTNKLVRKIPRYFVNQDTEKEVSTDLFKNLAIYNQAINNYKELDELEGVVLAIGRTEQNKNSIQTSYWGRPKRNPDSGELETIEDNAKNFDLYEKQLATLWYGQKYIQSDQFDILLGKVGPVVNKINDFLGFDLFPRSMDNRQLSMVKFIDALNNLFQQKTIGLNPLPSISNYFGGNANAIINSGRYFTKEDFIVSEMELTNLAIKGEKGKKMLAAIEYFMPFTDDMNRELARKLSLTFISDESIQDALFIMMRKLDRVVQASIFFALLKNQIFIDGKVVSARDYLRQKPEFKGKHISAEFEKAVKELIKQHGLLNVAELKDGKLVLPETERQSPEVFKIRNFTREITKKALGNMSPEEVRGVQQNILWRSAMIFKNWIPPLADVRFGEMKYNSALDAYEWGRARALFRFVLTNGIKSITNLRGAVLGNKEGMEQLQKLYEYKKKDYEEKTGKKFEMDEESFTDLVRENISSAGKDAIGMVLLVSLLITAHLAAPDDDEDDQTKNIHKFTVRALDKLTDELTFFYLPTSASQLLNSSIFPSIGVLTDILSVFNHFGKEIYGMTFDEELQERNHVIKYILKNFPIASQLSSYMPLYAPDMAKDLGIKMSTQSRR